MARLPGLFQRGSVWWLRVMIPLDIRGAFDGRSKVVRSLQTEDRREAARLGAQHRAHQLHGFALRRGGSTPQPLPLAPPHDIPTAPLVVHRVAGRRLRDAFDRWKVNKPRTPDTISTCERALILFESCLKDPALSTLTRSQGDEFRGWLQQQGTASKTARDRFTWIKSLLKYASRELEWISRSPWEGLDIESTVTKRRRPWTEDQLSTLFGLPLFTAYELPTVPKAGADAAYWIPLLGIFTGSRVSELCQLRIADIDTKSRVPALSITDEGAGQQVKTSASVRDIPIHSELIRLGFLEYVKATSDAGHARLFPALPLRKGKPGSYFSTWFGQSKPEGLPDFHSFRHLVRSTMAEAGQSEPAMDRVTGHEVRGSEGTRVYTQGTKQALQRAVEAIQYPGLRLPVVYRPTAAHRPPECGLSD